MSTIKMKGTQKMSEENKIINIEEEIDNSLIDEEAKTDDELKSAIETKLKEIQTQNLLIGAQTACTVILQKIAAWEAQPGKRTLNDHRRIIKDIKEFCLTGVSRKVNPDGTTSPRDGENDTKLMEEIDD